MKIDKLLKQAEENRNENSISSADEEFETERDAQKVFDWLKTKILIIDEWNLHALMSSYELFDESGKTAGDKIEIGKFIRIKIAASGKPDWVRVVDILENENEFIITVKPTFDPTGDTNDKKTISHFFTDESTNNFCIYKKDKTVAFYVIGLNEKANTSETGGALETIRNIAVNAGTYLGTQKSEWEIFCHHFLEDAAKENQSEK